MTKKVVCLVPKGTGGAQKMSILIAKFLKDSNFDVIIYFIGKKAEDDMSNLVPPNIKYHYIIVKNILDFVTLRIIRVLVKEKPSSIFCSIMYLNIRAIIAAKIVGGINIVVRNDNMLSAQNYLNKTLLKITYPKANFIIAQQDEMKSDLVDNLSLRRNKNKVVVLNNPIDKEAVMRQANGDNPYSTMDDSIIYVWTANFMQTGSKGQDILVKAFKRVHELIPKSHLYLLGDTLGKNSYFTVILNYIEENNLLDCVHIVGFKKNPYPWIKNANCFVLPSRIEGLPNSLVDAMFLCRPVVATRCIPMIERMIEEGVNGYSVPVGDVELMADAMIKAINLKPEKMVYNPSEAKDFLPLFV